MAVAVGTLKTHEQVTESGVYGLCLTACTLRGAITRITIFEPGDLLVRSSTISFAIRHCALE